MEAAGPASSAPEVEARPLRRMPGFAARALAACGLRYLRLYALELDLRQALPDVAPGIDLHVQAADQRDLELIRVNSEPQGWARVLKDVSSGARCFVALHSGDVAGYTFINDTSMPVLDGVDLGPLAADAVYSFHSHVFDRYRGQRVFQVLLQRVFGLLREEGVRYVCNFVDRDNVASVRARQKLGARGRPVTVITLPVLRPIVRGGTVGQGRLLGP